MDDIQSWWEVPSIAHFCSLFRAAFNLLDFDIEELEEALLTDGTEDCGSSLLQELIVRLLRGCFGNNDISTFNYQMFLRRVFRQKSQEYGRKNPFNSDIDFQFLPLRTKVEILHALCDFRLDASDVQDLLKNLEADSLRVEPLGHDVNRAAYWYFYGTRLYKQVCSRSFSKRKIKEKRRKEKEEKRRRKHGRSLLTQERDIRGTGVWQVVCFTEEDWDKITLGFKDSKSTAELELYHTLAEDFLPEIPRLFAEKERLQRKRLLEYQPRRQSSRLEKLKQQKEEEEILQKGLEKEETDRKERRKQEQDKKENLRRSQTVKEDKTNHACVGSHSRTNSECGSVGSFVESLAESRSGQSTTFVGRQTNNSLSSATGQIVIQGLRRKLRSSQVFRQTEEDLQTGMYKILEFTKNHEDAWPFLEPVDEQYAPRYYSIISRPMDLQRMEDKLDEGEYMTFSDFKSDFQLIVDNCRKYNGTDNEYTEMVGNLQQAFISAVDRYLESEPSSDEEIGVEFIDTIPEPPQIPSVMNNNEFIEIEEEPVRSPSVPPSMPSSPSSDEDENLPEMEQESEENSDAALEAQDSDASSTKDEAEEKDLPDPNSAKWKKKSGTKTAPDIEALELATEQTLKDINKWLDDTPRYSEFSSASNSPSHFNSTEEYEAGSRVDSEYRRNLKMEKPSRSKDSKDNSKKRPSKDPTKQMRRREVQRTIERLQPGKSKGNLISNMQNAGKVSEEGPPGKPKDTRSSLFPVVDEATPKLSLGTVLGTDVLGFGVGQSQHNFSAGNKEEDKSVLIPEEPPKPVLDVRPKTPESPLERENTEECTEKKEKEEIEVKAVNKDCRQEKAMPNLSAWFKAFGAPKSTSTTKKRPEALQDGASIDIINVEERRDVTNNFAIESAADKNIPMEAHSVIVHDVSRPPVVVATRLEETDPRCSLQQKGNGNNMQSPIPLATQQDSQRQRKVSTGSTVSERSSFSQDLMDHVDGSSPRLGLDEHLGNYSAPYPSPLHHSPMAASPVLSSPRPEEGSKFTSYPPLNGTIRVGFYQDTSFSLQKSSPEKTNYNSHSPKEQTHGIFPTYSPRMYPPHDPESFMTYQNQQTGPPTSASDIPYDNSSYAGPLMTYYDTSKPLTDQYRAARTQESDGFSPNSPTIAEVGTPVSTLTCSSPQPSLEVTSTVTTTFPGTVTTTFPGTVSTTVIATTTVAAATAAAASVASVTSNTTLTTNATIQKSSVTVFPVKKRLYSEIELCSPSQSTSRYQLSQIAPQVTPPPAHLQSGTPVLPPESSIIIDNAYHNRPDRSVCSTFEVSDKIVVPACEKIYSARKPTLNEPIFKMSEHTVQHISRKSQSVRTLQTNLNNGFEFADRLQLSSPETFIEYPNKYNPSAQTSPPFLREGVALTPQIFASRSSSGKKHSPLGNPDNFTSPNNEDPKPVKIQHTSVPVITSAHIANHQPRRDLSAKLEEQQRNEKRQQIAGTSDIVQSGGEPCAESVRRLHTTSITSTSPVPERLKSNSNAILHGNDMSYPRGPFSSVAPSSIGMEHLALHGNLRNLTQVVDRFPTGDRLLPGLASPASPFFGDKGLSSQYVFRQTVPNTMPTSVSSPPSAMTLLSQPSPPVMTVAYNHERQISPPVPFNRSVPELPSVLPNKVSNMQAYSLAVQDLSTNYPTKSSSPIGATTSFNRSVSELTTIHPTKASTSLNAQAAYISVDELSSMLPTNAATPVDLKSYNQSVTDLSMVLPNKVPIPPSIGVPSSYSQPATDYSLLASKTSDTQPIPKPSRKRKSKQTALASSEVPVITTASSSTASSSTAFQQYVGLSTSPNLSEASAIALKTATVLTGSAFNFGSPHSGLGLYTTDKDVFPGFLEDYRAASSSFYIPAPDPSLDKINPTPHPSAPAPSLAFPFPSHSGPPSFAIAQAFINHQSGLVDPSGSASTVYQQYLQRHSEELLRQTGTPMVLHQGLLPPPTSYPAGYHPALEIRRPYDTLNRPSWL